MTKSVFCGYCKEPCDFHFEGSRSISGIHFDPFSNCCVAPILDEKGEFIDEIEARQILREEQQSSYVPD